MLPVKQEHVFNVQLKRCKSFRKLYLQCCLTVNYSLESISLELLPTPYLGRMQMYFNKQIINNSTNNKNRNNINNINNNVKKYNFLHNKVYKYFLWRNSLLITIIQCIRRSISKDFFGISLTYLIEENYFR